MRVSERAASDRKTVRRGKKSVEVLYSHVTHVIIVQQTPQQLSRVVSGVSDRESAKENRVQKIKYRGIPPELRAEPQF